MATIETALRSYLMTQPDIVSMLQAPGGPFRYYPSALPPKVTLPASWYQFVSLQPTMSHDGDSNLDRSRVQITLVSKNYLDTINLSNFFRRALVGYRGLVDGIRLYGAILDDWRDTYDAELTTYARMADFMIWNGVEP